MENAPPPESNPDASPDTGLTRLKYIQHFRNVILLGFGFTFFAYNLLPQYGDKILRTAGVLLWVCFIAYLGITTTFSWLAHLKELNESQDSMPSVRETQSFLGTAAFLLMILLIPFVVFEWGGVVPFVGIATGALLFAFAVFGGFLIPVFDRKLFKQARAQVHTLDLLMLVSVWGNVVGLVYSLTKDYINPDDLRQDFAQAGWLMLLLFVVGAWLIEGMAWTLKYEPALQSRRGWGARWRILILSWIRIPFEALSVASVMGLIYGFMLLFTIEPERRYAPALTATSVLILVLAWRWRLFHQRLQREFALIPNSTRREPNS